VLKVHLMYELEILLRGFFRFRLDTIGSPLECSYPTKDKGIGKVTFFYTFLKFYEFAPLLINYFREKLQI
jgi:hypothetical protein